MTNYERLKNRTIVEVAQDRIISKTERLFDYDSEDNYVDTGYDEHSYVTDDGIEYEYYEYDEAIASEIAWLDSEVDE